MECEIGVEKLSFKNASQIYARFSVVRSMLGKWASAGLVRTIVLENNGRSMKLYCVADVKRELAKIRKQK